MCYEPCHDLGYLRFSMLTLSSTTLDFYECERSLKWQLYIELDQPKLDLALAGSKKLVFWT